MCGICGFTGKPENREDVIRKMTEVITHRGPDSEGFYSDDAVCMGFRRLSIIDLKSGDQPIFNEDKSLVLTFNGEIYNYKELREELEGLNHSFATDSDSEVLVHAFEQWQEDMLPRLRGMFGFAIYNKKDGSIFLARDFFGIKPMHYTMIGNDFVYASEIKSILEHPDFEKRFNNRALDSYLSFQYALPPETFFEEVYCLLPGHYLWYKNGSYDTTRYFEPKFRPKENMTEEEAVDKIEKVFENSVNAHKIADVEVGCFLSSGVDSSYVSTYFADQKTFTVGFDFGEKYNEISWAETLCRIIDVEHHTHLISSAEFWDAVPTVQYYMDQPLADPSCVALYFVSRLASQYVKVVLSGEGADELFGGYTCYNDPRVFKMYQKIVPHFLRKALRAVAKKLPDIKGRDFVIRACDKLEDRYIGNAFMYDKQEKQELLKNPAIATAPQRSTRRHYYRCRRYDDVTKMQYLDINLWLTGDILLKADRMSMANSLELRVPFLDKEVFKVASSLPTQLRVNKANTKYAMRKAAARHLPESTAEKEKLGFPVPTRVWLRDEKYYNVVKQRFQSETAEKFFNTEVLIKWLDQHFSGKEDNSRRVWTVYVFLVWYDIYFNEKAPHPEKPENHLDELKALAEEERARKAAGETAPAETGEQSGAETAEASEENSEEAAEEAPATEEAAEETAEGTEAAPETDESKEAEDVITAEEVAADGSPVAAESTDGDDILTILAGAEAAAEATPEPESVEVPSIIQDAQTEQDTDVLSDGQNEQEAQDFQDAQTSQDFQDAQTGQDTDDLSDGQDDQEAQVFQDAQTEQVFQDAQTEQDTNDLSDGQDEQDEPDVTETEPEAPDEDGEDIFEAHPGEDATADDFLEGLPEEGETLEEFGEEAVREAVDEAIDGAIEEAAGEAPEEAAEEAVEEATEEAPVEEVEEIPVPEELPDEPSLVGKFVEEEPVVEEATEEAPSEEVAEEAATDEATKEEAPTEETPVEEAPTEEAPAEETAEEAPEEAPTEETENNDDITDDIPFAEEVVDDSPIEEDMWKDNEAMPIDEGSMPALIENGDEPGQENGERKLEEYVNISNPDDKEVYREPKDSMTPKEQVQLALDSIARRARYLDEPNVISDEAVFDIITQIRAYNEENEDNK